VTDDGARCLPPSSVLIAVAARLPDSKRPPQAIAVCAGLCESIFLA